MEKDKSWFLVAVIAGFVVMILFALVTVNILKFIPIFGPFVGGLVAGLIAGKDFLNGAKAAVIAGLLGAVAVSFDIMVDTPYLTAMVPQLPQVTGIFFLILAIFYFPILAFFGGVIGGAIRYRE